MPALAFRKSVAVAGEYSAGSKLMSSVRKFLQVKGLSSIALALCLSFTFCFIPWARSAEPRIDFISNITHSVSVAIHFSTPQEQTRMYVLQYQNSAPCPTN